MAEEYDYLFKTVIIGDGGCGKTAIVVRFSQGFFEENYKLTIGVEFAVKTISIDTKDNRHLNAKLQIWDTGGQERFQYVRPLYYKGAMGAILLYDVTNRESFDHITKWIEELEENGSGNIPKLLVGNKVDLTDSRVVSRQEAEDFAQDMGYVYVESSAKTGIGVGDLFEVLALLMMGEDITERISQPSSITPAAQPVASKPQPISVKPTPTPVAQVTPKPVPKPQPAFTPRPAVKAQPAFTPRPAVNAQPAFTPKPAAKPNYFAPKTPSRKPQPVQSMPAASAQSAPATQVAGKHADFVADDTSYAPPVPKRREPAAAAASPAAAARPTPVPARRISRPAAARPMARAGAPIAAKKKSHSRFSSFLNALQENKEEDLIKNEDKSFGFMSNASSSSTPATASPKKPAKAKKKPKKSLKKNQIQCPNCGSKLNSNFMFCNKCGQRLK